MGTPLLKALIFERRLPWRYKVKLEQLPWIKENMRFRDYIFLININKFLLRLQRLPKYDKEDITIILAVKDRYDGRIVNCFRSIRNQNYKQGLIKIILVDYNSKDNMISKFRRLCKKYNVEYIRINNKPIWCKSHALNIIIKKIKTKYILSSDVDIIFKKDYIREAIKELQKNPFQIILSDCFLLKKNSLNNNINLIKDYNKLKMNCKKIFGPGINLSLTYFYQKINGYDEQYKGWGKEDKDLIKRFGLLGLNIKMISDKTYYLHQWHPKYYGIVKGKKLYNQIKKNIEYLKKNNSIMRNNEKWGEI